ncbi:MAG: hypothetical protein ABIK28_17645 [Planctomycetota bacterium]
MIDNHAFGSTSGTRYSTLEGSFVPPSTGLYTLKVENTRSLASSTLLYNYIDNISLRPFYSTFNISGKPNISCISGGYVLFSISAGFGNGGKDYWIWFNVSGTYPGFTWNGLNFPLNQDLLFWMGIQYPSFPGTTGFFGTLSGSGSGVATMSFPKNLDQSLLGIPINFIYVLLSPGLQPPALAVSFPVHVKYCPL